MKVLTTRSASCDLKISVSARRRFGLLVLLRRGRCQIRPHLSCTPREQSTFLTTLESTWRSLFRLILWRQLMVRLFPALLLFSLQLTNTDTSHVLDFLGVFISGLTLTRGAGIKSRLFHGISPSIFLKEVFADRSAAILFAFNAQTSATDNGQTLHLRPPLQ